MKSAITFSKVRTLMTIQVVPSMEVRREKKSAVLWVKKNGRRAELALWCGDRSQDNGGRRLLKELL